MRFVYIKLNLFLLIYIILIFSPICSIAKNSNYQERLFSINLNGLPTNEVALFLKDSQRMVWIKADTLNYLRINNFKLPSITYNGSKFYCLNKFKAITYHVDTLESTINMQVPLGYFHNYSFRAQHNPILIPQKSPLGGFFNYDLFGQRTTDRDDIANGNFEFGVFNNFGVITTNFLTKHTDSMNRIIRLDSTWQIDEPQKMQTWRFGDSINAPGDWGRAVSFGGIQWSRNFSTQPGFIKFPLPAMKGTAVVPSTADVFINNALVAKGDVPVGPFDVTNIPVVTGPGNITLVTTDVLGRQQIVNVPYYASTRILRQGLHDFSFAAGLAREDYGINSNKYSNLLLSATDQYGITNKLTSTFHGEALDGIQAAGFGENYLLLNYGVASFSVAGSRSSHGKFGGLVMVGFNRTGKILSYGLNAKFTDNNFRQIGYDTYLPPAAETQGYISLFTGHTGSFSISYTGRENRDQPNQRFLTASYSTNFTKNIYFNVSGVTNIGGERSRGIYLTIVANLGNRTTGSINFDHHDHSDQYGVQIQRNLPLGSGYGYRLNAVGGDNPYVNSGISVQKDFGKYSAQVAWENRHALDYQVDASGGIAILNNDIFFSRKIDQSFAVVKVPGYKNIPVYLENHVVAHTDSYDNAFIPNLIAYDPNHISVDPSELPMDAEFSKTKFEVMPYYRSGVIVTLPIKHSYSRTLIVKDQKGKVIPVGSIAKVSGQTNTFIVGYEGVLYLTGLKKNNSVVIRWNGNRCSFNLSYRPDLNSLTDMQTIECKGLKNE